MIDWTDEAIDSALQELHGSDWRGVSEKMNDEAVAEMRAALDAAVKAQGNGSFSLTTFLAYEAGRNEALEEAAKMVARTYGRDGVKIAKEILALKGETK